MPFDLPLRPTAQQAEAFIHEVGEALRQACTEQPARVLLAIDVLLLACADAVVRQPLIARAAANALVKGARAIVKSDQAETGQHFFPTKPNPTPKDKP